MPKRKRIQDDDRKRVHFRMEETLYNKAETCWVRLGFKTRTDFYNCLTIIAIRVEQDVGAYLDGEDLAGLLE